MTVNSDLLKSDLLKSDLNSPNLLEMQEEVDAGRRLAYEDEGDVREHRPPVDVELYALFDGPVTNGPAVSGYAVEWATWLWEPAEYSVGILSAGWIHDGLACVTTAEYKLAAEVLLEVAKRERIG